LLGLGILFGLGVVIAYWPIFVAAGIAFGAFIAARAAVRRHRRRQCAHAQSPPAPISSTLRSCAATHGAARLVSTNPRRGGAPIL
jgi:hypothetical protein